MKFLLADDGKTSINVKRVRVIFIGRGGNSCRVYANFRPDYYDNRHKHRYGICLKDFSKVDETEEFKAMQDQLRKLAGGVDGGNAFKLGLDKNVMAKNYFDKLFKDLNAENPSQFILAESGTEIVNTDNISAIKIVGAQVIAYLYDESSRESSYNDVLLKTFDSDTEAQKYFVELIDKLNSGVRL